MRMMNPGVPTIAEWLNDVLLPGCRIGIDPVSYSVASQAICNKSYEMSKKIYEFVLADRDNHRLFFLQCM